MALTEKLHQALNSQIKYELESAYIYLSMATYLEAKGFEGAAHWMNVQVKEEVFHAAKLHKFLADRDADITLQEIPAPPHTWESFQAVFEAALAHEKKITEKITNIMELAQKDKDHPSMSLMQWYVDEQVEEEANLVTILNKLKIIKNDPSSLFMLDRDLATRPLPTPDPTMPVLFG